MSKKKLSVNQKIEKLKDDITLDFTEQIKYQIAQNFPTRLNKVVDEFFIKEITPGLLKFLGLHKKEIIEKLEKDLIKYAISIIRQKCIDLLTKYVDGISEADDKNDPNW